MTASIRAKRPKWSARKTGCFGARRSERTRDMPPKIKKPQATVGASASPMISRPRTFSNRPVVVSNGIQTKTAKQAAIIKISPMMRLDREYLDSVPLQIQRGRPECRFLFRDCVEKYAGCVKAFLKQFGQFGTLNDQRAAKGTFDQRPSLLWWFHRLQRRRLQMPVRRVRHRTFRWVLRTKRSQWRHIQHRIR